MLRIKSIKAISLLELMLSLAIIAGLMFAVTLYYRQAEEARKIKETQEQINLIFAKADEIRNLNNGYHFCNLNHALFPLILKAIDRKYLIGNWLHTPFGDHSQYDCSNSTRGKFYLKVINIPKNACIKLKATYHAMDGITVENATNCNIGALNQLELSKTH